MTKISLREIVQKKLFELLKEKAHEISPEEIEIVLTEFAKENLEKMVKSMTVETKLDYKTGEIHAIINFPYFNSSQQPVDSNSDN